MRYSQEKEKLMAVKSKVLSNKGLDEVLVLKDGEQGYRSFSHIFEKANRPKVQRADGREIGVRRYELGKKRDNLIKRWHEEGKFPSPFSKGHSTDLINALVRLGENRAWSFDEICKEMKKEMEKEVGKRGKSRWEEYEGKVGCGTIRQRVEYLVLDWRKRVGVGSNFPAGHKLEQLGVCVDVFYIPPVWSKDRRKRSKGISSDLYLRLNTYSTAPIKDTFRSIEDFPSVNFRGKTLGPRNENNT
jgi:hypothetical protein